MEPDYYHDDPTEFSTEKSRKKKLIVLLSFSVFTGAFFFQGVLAANINLNIGSQVEFGQGIVQTIACDGDGITLLPQAEFVNSSGSGSHVLKSIVVSQVDSSSNGCQDKTLTFKGFGNASSTSLNLVNSVNSIVVVVSSGAPIFSIPATIGVTLTNVNSSGFTISFDPTASPISANEIFRFSVESSAPGTGTSLVVSRASVGSTAGVAFTTQPQITIKDSNNNTVTTSNALVTATISSGGDLVGTRTATAVSGVATFSNLGVRGFGGTAYTISYSVSGLVPATQSVTPTAYAIGAIGPGGGRIFYVSNSAGFTCGVTLNEKCYYLEVAPPALGLASWDTDTVNSVSRTWAQSPYQTTAVPNFGTLSAAEAIGYGYRNTRLIIDQGNSNPAISAAALAQSFSGGGFSDWFLPSRQELNTLCQWQTANGCYGTPTIQNNVAGATGFSIGPYWSSSEISASDARYRVNQQGGDQGGGSKSSNALVRPIRAF
jgi:hypothetical protein